MSFREPTAQRICIHDAENYCRDAYNHFNPSIPPPHSTTPSNLAPTPLSGPQPSCKPGNHQEGPDAYVGYKTCSVKGLTYWNLLDEALRDPHHQDRTDGLSTFQKYYTGIFDDTVAVDPEAYQDFLDHSLSADHIDISTSAEKGKIGKFFAPFTNAFDTADGAIIALVNWRDFDKAQALQWSKLMYQTWRAASAYADHEHKFGILPDHPPGGPISNLKCVVQHIVTNEGTKKVLRTMHRNRGYSINQGGVSGRNGRRGKSIIGFCAGGTDNVRGFLWLLRDYAGEMGRAMRKCRGKF